MIHSVSTEKDGDLYSLFTWHMNINIVVLFITNDGSPHSPLPFFHLWHLVKGGIAKAPGECQVAQSPTRGISPEGWQGHP